MPLQKAARLAPPATATKYTGSPADSWQRLGLALVLFGLAGVIGNVWATRRIGTAGPTSNVTLSLWSMCAGMLVLAAAGASWAGFVLGALAWGGGVFANNSSQQARLVAASPALAGASIALNTSMIYLGQAIGTSLGGAVIAGSSYSTLPVVGAVVLLAALALSWRAERRNR